ncbi:lymphotactin-like [Elgaria multicarinata webbii]|uniref:lymphotactin-like n=1 Tax=Elgaria multicarinata webbii TaxID=159646 RepID=UPI002FCD57D5
MKLYVAAILAISFLENFKVFIFKGTFGSQTLALSSCVDLDSRVINIQRIADYETQTRPIKAVIFITKSGVKVCVPHNLPWVKRHINKLKRRTTKKQKIITPRPKAVTG